MPATFNKSTLPNTPHSLRPALMFLAGYSLLFFWLAYRKYALFGGNSADTSIIAHAFWATVHGKFFPDYTLEMCYFGDHASYVLLLLVPIYWVFQSVPTLLFLQSVFIAAAGIPMYLIARRALNDTFAAGCIMAAFLFFPTIASQHVATIHDTQFIIVFLLFAFYFYYTENFRWFAVLAALSCLGKENVGLTVIMFGVYAALQRRNWKWIVTPIALGAVAMGLIFKVIMPYFRGGKPYRSFGYFGSLGETPAQVLATAVTQPGKFLGALFTGPNVMYVIQLVQPVAWALPFLSLPVIFVLPDLGVNLLVENMAPRVIRWHYNLTVGSFLFVATIFSVGKLSGWLTKRYGVARYAAGFGVLLACLSVSHWVLWFDLSEYQRPPEHAALREALDLVPDEASVLAPQTMLAQVASRWHFSTIQHWLVYRKPTQPEKIFEYKYVIINANERRAQWAVVPLEVIQAFASNPHYELIFNKNNVLVFRRIGDDVLASANL